MKLVSVIAILVCIFLLAACDLPMPTAPAPTAPAAITITSLNDLPQQGELIIPKSFQFKIPDGMTGTIWSFPERDRLNNAIEYSAGVAVERVKRYGGTLADYPILVWGDQQYPAGEGDPCPPTMGQSAMAAKDSMVGNKNCFMMLEYYRE